LLANKASDFLLAMGNPRIAPGRPARGFIQDDWRVTDRFVLNLVFATTTILDLATSPSILMNPAEVNI